jgi:Ca2+-binding EF-hand superfamily protein
MSDWDMDNLDLDKNGTLSFEEFGGSQLERLRAAYNMLDSNEDGELDLDEWNEFLKVHGKTSVNDS